MKIVKEKILLDELKEMAKKIFGNLVKSKPKYSAISGSKMELLAPESTKASNLGPTEILLCFKSISRSGQSIP